MGFVGRVLQLLNIDALHTGAKSMACRGGEQTFSTILDSVEQAEKDIFDLVMLHLNVSHGHMAIYTD